MSDLRIYARLNAPIPQELIDHIISLVDCRLTLNSCTLVRSNWLRASQKHLFHTVRIPYRDEERPEEERHDVQTISSFLDSSPHLSRLIWVLFIGDGFYHHNSRTTLDILYLLLLKLSNLEDLHILGLGFFLPSTLRASPARFDLRLLRFKELGRDMDNVTDLFPVLHLFTNIGTLAFEGITYAPVLNVVTWREEIVYDLSEYDFPLHLKIRSLRVHATESTFEILVLESLRRSQSAGILSTIQVDGSEYQRMCSLSPYFRYFGECLRHVSFSIIYGRLGNDMVEDWKTMTSKISNCASLKSLTLTIHTKYDRATCYSLKESMWSRLSYIVGVVPDSLSRLTISVRGYLGSFKNSIGHVDWSELDQYLCRLPMMETTVVHIGIFDKNMMFGHASLEPMREEISKIFKDNLPQAHSRGLLQFTIGDEIL